MTLLAQPTGNRAPGGSRLQWPSDEVTRADAAERAWRATDPRRPRASVTDLLARARRSVTAILTEPGASAPTRLAAARVYDLVSRLAFDGAPTPQIAVGEDGVDVVWLVEGESVNADFYGQGQCTLWLTDSTGAETLTWTGGAGAPIPEPLLAAAEVALRRMSRNVRFSVPE